MVVEAQLGIAVFGDGVFVGVVRARPCTGFEPLRPITATILRDAPSRCCGSSPRLQPCHCHNNQTR